MQAGKIHIGTYLHQNSAPGHIYGGFTHLSLDIEIAFDLLLGADSPQIVLIKVQDNLHRR